MTHLIERLTAPRRAPVPEPHGPRGFRERLWAMKSYRESPFRFFETAFEKYGPIVLSNSFGLNFFIISSPEDIEHVLVKNARNYTKDRFLRNWKRVFGQGLLTSEGEIWKRERRMVQPAFHRDRMASYGKLMLERTLETLRSWNRQKKSEFTLIANREMMELTLDIVVRTLFGTDLPPGTERKVGLAFEKCSHYFELTGEPIGYWMGKLPLKTKRDYYKGVQELDEILFSIVRTRRSTGSNDLLSTLLAVRDEDGSPLTDQQIRDELMTLFLAGHETTALSLTYSLFLLAKYPEIQSRARNEIFKVLGTGPLEVSYLEKLPFIRQIVQESLRLYPPAWILARDAIESDRLSGFNVPAGSGVVIPTWAIHRKESVFRNAEQFIPDRWTEEFTHSLPRAAYLPFGFGPRMCIGSVFAMMEAQLILISILSRFEIVTASPEHLELRASITARPSEDILLTLRPIGKSV